MLFPPLPTTEFTPFGLRIHLILYTEEEEVTKSFAESLKDGLKALGLGRNAKQLLSDIESLHMVTSLDLDSADDSLELSKFPNLKKLTINLIDNASVLKSWDVPQSLEENHLGDISNENYENISSFISNLPSDLKKLTIRGRKLKWFQGMLDFSKFQKLLYLSIRGEGYSIQSNCCASTTRRLTSLARYNFQRTYSH
ncbi:hypothetical protein CANMA_004634 [Candida margitis]|uniref:uncharacterized protein n=1 Tax=Candida margitis TaxID=1775924 RepID=UPI0022261CA3|nr:uncharacterized protein CANMA_004634 [Candida margitis]KAI5953796.1 hypothetical protein CANMA_004634 [Candida margitis]